VNKFIWHIYAYVYDAVLLKLIPYRMMIDEVCQALDSVNGNYYLDAGCGTGNYLKPFFDSGKSNNIRITAIDCSQSMITRAKGKIKGNGKQVDFYKLDLNNKLPFEDETFEGIICVNVLYSIQDPEEMIGEFYRVLKKQGKLVLITPLDQPKILPIIREHIDELINKYPKKWRVIFLSQLVKSIIPMILFIPINLYITANNDFWFLTEEQIKSLLTSSNYCVQDSSLIYGRQNIFILARK